MCVVGILYRFSDKLCVLCIRWCYLHIIQKRQIFREKINHSIYLVHLNYWTISSASFLMSNPTFISHSFIVGTLYLFCFWLAISWCMCISIVIDWDLGGLARKYVWHFSCKASCQIENIGTKDPLSGKQSMHNKQIHTITRLKDGNLWWIYNVK